jgi:hypothetical protein
MGPGVPGRPKKLGKFSLRAVSDKAGFVQLNQTPEAIQSANRNYLKKGTLPPSLMPKNGQPKVQQARTNRNISRGFNKPKDGR